jgi:acetyl-CoA C-acetyltransferase
VQEVIMGCVLPAGLKQGPARQAALNAGLPSATGCTTINELCGSGMKAVMLTHDLLKAGTNSMMVAGGMESMSTKRPVAACAWATTKSRTICF